MNNQQNEINSNFIYTFKIGDKIVQNFKLLHLLYQYLEKEKYNENINLLYKAIILILVSIAEASLADFFQRTKGPYTDEKPYEKLEEIKKYFAKKGKEDERFAEIIKDCQRLNLFECSSFDIYSSLKKLKDVRNKIHIQDVKEWKNEDEIFTESVKEEAEKTVEYVLRYLSNFPRGDKKYECCQNFSLPWESWNNKGILKKSQDPASRETFVS